MTDQSRILDEAETLDLLRAGRAGDEPPLTDVTPLALRGGLRMRRRRQAGQIGAGLVFAGVAGLAFAVATPGLTPGGRSDVVTVDSPPDPTTAPDPAGTVEPGNAKPYETTAEQNLRVLNTHLGKGWQRETPDAQTPFEGSLRLKPGSAVAKKGLDQSGGPAALPAGYGARAHVSVYSTPEDHVCDPDAALGKNGDTCVLVEGKSVPAGAPVSAEPNPTTRRVLIGSHSSPLEAGVPVEIRHGYFIQPDGDVVDVSLAVLPDTVQYLSNDDVPRTAIKDWLETFGAALYTAATDPEMAPGSAAEREVAEETSDVYARNQTLLADHLGAAFRANGRKVLFAADGAAYPSLPGYTTEAVLRSGRSEVELDRMCDESFDQEHTATCERRTTPAGDVIVQTWADSDSDLSTQGRTAIYFLNPYHEGVVIHFLVSEFAPPPTMSAEERTSAILAWLRSYEDELIAAATDPGVSRDGEAF